MKRSSTLAVQASQLKEKDVVIRHGLYFVVDEVKPAADCAGLIAPNAWDGYLVIDMSYHSVDSRDSKALFSEAHEVRIICKTEAWFHVKVNFS